MFPTFLAAPIRLRTSEMTALSLEEREMMAMILMMMMMMMIMMMMLMMVMMMIMMLMMMIMNIRLTSKGPVRILD